MNGFRSRSLSFRVVLTAAFAVVVSLASAHAEEVPGVTANSILIGSCSALEGPARFLGTQTVLGATAYIHYINEQGGVNGRKIKLLAFDDSYDPEKAPACFKRMQREGVFALGFFVGTPTAAKYVPLANEDKIPVIGLFTGAQLLYEPLKHYVINVRASYYDETREQVDKLWNDLGVHQIGVIYQDDVSAKPYFRVWSWRSKNITQRPQVWAPSRATRSMCKPVWTAYLRITRKPSSSSALTLPWRKL